MSATSVSTDRAKLQEFDPDSLVVTDLCDGFFPFDDGTYELHLGFHRRDWTPLDREEIDEVVFIGPELIPLDMAAQDEFIWL